MKAMADEEKGVVDRLPKIFSTLPSVDSKCGPMNSSGVWK